MAELEEYRQNIIENFNNLEDFIEKSPLFSTDNKKWKAQVNSQLRQIKNQIRQLEQEVNELPSSEACSYVGPIKSFKKKLQKLENDCEKKQRGDSVFGLPKTNIIQTDEQKRQNAMQELFRKGDEAQDNTKASILEMNKITERGVQLANQTNLMLTSQIQQLDRMRDKVKDTESTLKKAKKNITYFAKALECDKCMVGLLILIFFALVAVIVLAIKKSQSS